MEASPFGKLPAELRNKIYELVLPRNETLQIHSIDRRRGAREKIVDFLFSRKNINALLLTCKRTRQDCAGLFYANNTFRIVSEGHHTAVAACFADEASAAGGSSVIKELIMVPWRQFHGHPLGQEGLKDLFQTFRTRSANMARNARLLGQIEELRFEIRIRWGVAWRDDSWQPTTAGWTLSVDVREYGVLSDADFQEAWSTCPSTTFPRRALMKVMEKLGISVHATFTETTVGT